MFHNVDNALSHHQFAIAL